MAKGLFTQGMCVLLRQPVAVSELQARLKDFQIVGRTEAPEENETQETLVLNYRAEVGGHLLVTLSDSPWPDDMGDPELTPDRFVAWSLGQFGPLAFPGCLQRAGEQSWGWEGAAEAVAEHKAHVRILVSYVLGPEEEAEAESDDELPLIPNDYDSLEELKFLTKAVAAILEMPEAICYFNPGGEVLRDENGLRQGLNSAWNLDIPPLDMWTNVRLFRAADDWSLMDTVGNGQFDLPDMEAIYLADRYEPAEVEGFLRNATLYLLSEDEEVEDGDTADGPGSVSWMALECNDALTDPPRPTIRWVPQDGTEPPSELLEIGEAVDDDDEDEDDEDEEEDEFDEPYDLFSSSQSPHDFGNALFGSESLKRDLSPDGLEDDDDMDDDIDADFPDVDPLDLGDSVEDTDNDSEDDDPGTRRS